jgi:CRISPR-associated protein Csb2
LPGYDDKGSDLKKLRNENPPLAVDEKNAILRRLDARIERLLRKALLQSGIPRQLAGDAQIEWRCGSFFPGVDMAARYLVPEQHRRFRRLHVRICWRDTNGETLKISGPICLGGGRFSGLGLLASVDAIN